MRKDGPIGKGNWVAAGNGGAAEDVEARGLLKVIVVIASRSRTSREGK